MSLSDELDDARRGLHHATANLDYALERFGDRLAGDEGYKDVDGMDAIWLYLIRKYRWTPAYVKSMKGEDIRLVLSVEMQGFTLDKK